MSDTGFYCFGGEYSETYTNTCSNCGRTIEVSTQRDNYPEYYTEVHIKCTCGSSVRFDLPVN